MRTRVQKWGNSLGLRIPKPFAESLDLEEGSTVDVSVKEGVLVVAPEREPEIALEKLLERVTESNQHGEVDTGAPLGREAW